MAKIRLTRPERRTQETQLARTGEDLGVRSAPSHVRTRTHADAPSPAKQTMGGGSPLKGETTTPQSVVKKNKENQVDILLGQASSLSAADRKELLARLSLAEQEVDPRDRDLGMWSQAIYDALVKALGSSPGPALIRKVLGVHDSWGPVQEFMQSSKLIELPVTKRQSVYGLLARLVVEEAKEVSEFVEAPLGPKFVAGRCRYVAGTFDRAFPGYLKSGLASIVAARLAAGGGP